MKSKIAQFLILCILFTMVLPLNVRAATDAGLTFEVDNNYVNGDVYGSVTADGVMANQGNYLAWNRNGLVRNSSDGINWTSGSSILSEDSVGGNLYSIVYNNTEKKYVGIGNNFYASSVDGKTWQSEASSQNPDINDLLYANGNYYAVSSDYGGRIQKSTDGKSWSNLMSGLPDSGENDFYNLNAITYGGGKYIVVGSQGKVLTSNDGESWSNQTLGTAGNFTSLNDVIYADGKYVIVGDDGTIYTSLNGNDWVKRVAPGLTDYEDYLSSISYGKGKYVVVGGSKVLTSTDGITWSAQSSPSQYYQVCFDSIAGFVTMSDNGNAGLSTDGVSWTEKSMKSTQTTIDYIEDLKFLNNKYVAVGTGFMTSSDGIAWIKKNETEDITRISYGNNKYVGIGSGVVKTSTDGVTWQQQAVNAEDNFSPVDITYGNGKFVLVGTDISNGCVLIRCSTDGANWTQYSPSSVANEWLEKVIYANGLFIATGGDKIITSPDGQNWSHANTGLNSNDYNRILDLTMGNGQIIAVGSPGVILSSSDGRTWTKRDSGTTDQLRGISYGKGQFVAIGEQGTVLSSKDGATWKAETPLTYQWLRSITSNGSGFLIVGDKLFRSISTSVGDKTALTTVITNATALLASKPIGAAVGNVSQAAHDTYNTAISNVTAVKNNAAATQAQVDAAVTVLATATTAFNTAIVNAVSVSYQGHVQNIGWQKPVSDGQISGTEGQGLRVEALKINLANAPAGASIKYQAHVQNVGWQNWVSNGQEVGTDGQGLRVEALKITLENMPGYSVQYQAHVQSIGWQDWVSDGLVAGTNGQSLRIEAIRIRIVKNIGVQYQGHVETIGWQNPVFNGEISGTEGKGLRVEALKINLINAPAEASIKYQAHVQNIGWQDWVSNGQEVGTDGQSLRVEALRITLENMPGYSIQYQAHVESIGWQDWVSDGLEAGTNGQSLRIEAIRIRIVKN